jgi:PIN domain nuclease of toxin-antitoxin system
LIRAVLDTHILIWWRQGATGRLSATQSHFLQRIDQEGRFVISAITLWEIAKLVEARRLEISRPLDLWLAEIEQHPRLDVEPLTSRIVTASTVLENFHRDPADQLIVATAFCLGLPLVTNDQQIRRWGGVITV